MINKVRTEDGHYHKEIYDHRMTITYALGRGVSCKVKAADASRTLPQLDKRTLSAREVPVIQHLAVKIYNKTNLQNEKMNDFDALSGATKMSD